MNRKNNTMLAVVVASLATLTVVMIIILVLIFTGVFPLGRTNLQESGKTIPGQVESGELSSEPESPTVPENPIVPEDSTVPESPEIKPSSEDSVNQAPSVEPTVMYVANVKNSIYLRSEPVENNSNIITEIPVGEQVLWYENTDNVFSEISYNGMRGYAKKEYSNPTRRFFRILYSILLGTVIIPQ